MATLTDLEAQFREIFDSAAVQEDEIRRLSLQIRKGAAAARLGEIETEQLRESGAAVPVDLLCAAGYTDLGKIMAASDGELLGISGIGEKKLAAVRSAVAQFLAGLAELETLRIDLPERRDAESGGNDELQRRLLRMAESYRRAEAVRADAEGARGELEALADDLLTRQIVTNGVKWFFAPRWMREETYRTYEDLTEFLDGPLFARGMRFVMLYHDAVQVPEEEAGEAYRLHAASFYALFERLGGSRMPKRLLYESIPEQLAAQVDAFEPDLSGFHGDLRAYQAFGMKYILVQERVLLGDEMGLGKTVQAIAAMAHLYAREPWSFFLVVCPASVLVNWCREVRSFSDMPVFLIHGSTMEEDLAKWEAAGGIAVTNYESMETVAGQIDNRMKLSMLVIDEAHYVKNPEAQRTKHVSRILDEAERICMMTGTPLENHVGEMCALIRLIRPDLSEQIEKMANLSRVPEFREVLSPVYLRRTRDQVLSELPPIEEEDQWCDMTPEDRSAYITALEEESFMQLRRVSFLQEDLSRSAKAVRLLQICRQATQEGRQVLIYSYFRETVAKVADLLGTACAGVITGDVPPEKRQLLIDRFADSGEGSALVCQIQAGGTGLNIQCASIVIFCEPQVKPSLEAQALSRVYRMGQVRNVLVYRLLCEDTVDEAMVRRLSEKQAEFDAFAEGSAMAEMADRLIDQDWIRQMLEKERQKYLPMVV